MAIRKAAAILRDREFVSKGYFPTPEMRSAALAELDAELAEAYGRPSQAQAQLPLDASPAPTPAASKVKPS